MNRHRQKRIGDRVLNFQSNGTQVPWTVFGSKPLKVSPEASRYRQWLRSGYLIPDRKQCQSIVADTYIYMYRQQSNIYIYIYIYTIYVYTA